MALTLTGVYNARQLQIVVINSVLVFLSLTSVSLRFWARKLQRLKPFLEDYLIVVALALSLGVNILLFQSLHAGVGEHVDSRITATVQKYSLNLYMMQLFWNTCLPVIKLSIALFHQRIFPVRSMVIACRFIIVFLFAWYLAFQTTAIFQCTPIHHAWRMKTTQGRCIDFVPFVITLAATDLLTLPTRVCIISGVRLENLIAISNADITWSDTYSHLWTAIESSLGVVVACLPSLMPIGSYELSQLSHSNRLSSGPGRPRLRAGSSDSALIEKFMGEMEVTSEMAQLAESSPTRT
ncbi:uncharacterized protein BO72DRAFT_509227 [Aspergillus fijiensis CBS 313.89]|uniref:Rhodopsin domain-containing protein n=1 Tax=Aspergillus fijiensis CBS 313.89 TaxID=1448319 RepID=A0A8G1W1V1_9EURO|nr:uncharacterized protein BO72DRAFT_509227 [Aspergillus fijiensis CBS 313.89]RAK77404.1 hypothetical protein BO72DRAFT_509227 [Aspergillus fijiensis CBS 313.89]